LDYADPKRMPIDEQKVADLLKNKGLYRHRIEKDVETYQPDTHNFQFENGVLTIMNEASYGEMRDLMRDIGIRNKTIEFTNVDELLKQRDQLMPNPSDSNFNYLMNALFTPLDMTDYENSFVGWNEVGKTYAGIQNQSLLSALIEEPDKDPYYEENEEDPPFIARSSAHRDYL
jgi:hypothetical protein